MIDIDHRLLEPTPLAPVILKFLRSKDCGILDVSPTEFQGQPALRFSFQSDGVELKSILKSSRYLILKEERDSIVTLAFKRKKLVVNRGSTFTVPENYAPRGRYVTKTHPEYKNSARMVRTVTERQNVLLPNRSYAILRFPPIGELRVPIVLDVTDSLEAWQSDGKSLADKANADNLGEPLSVEEMRWVYRTALLNIEN